MQQTPDILLRKALLELVLLSSEGVSGRKRLQKIVYLADSIGWNIFRDYRFHHYGPYSEYLLSEVQNLCALRMIEVHQGTYNDRPLYLHELTEKGHSLLKLLLREIQRRNPSLIKRTNGLVRELNNFSARELEVMASLYYLKRESPSLGKKDLATELKRLKPYIGKSGIEDGFRIFNIMRTFAAA